MAPVFSIEYQTGAAAIILSAEHGKKKAIVLIFLIIMVPATLDKSIGVQGILQKILSVMPHQLMLGWNLITTFMLHDINGKIFTTYQILPILYSLITIILLPFTYWAFRRHQIE